MNMEFHPIADVFPLMEGQDFEELAQSIKENGQRDPIMTFNELILDGRNRYRACQAAGVEPLMEEYTGNDPLAYVVDKNMRRRHMEIGQRAMVAAEIAKLKSGRPKTSSRDPVSSNSEAAAMMDVSEASVKRAKEILRDGTPEEIASVMSGDKTVGEVASKIRQKKKSKEPAAETEPEAYDVASTKPDEPSAKDYYTAYMLRANGARDNAFWNGPKKYPDLVSVARWVERHGIILQTSSIRWRTRMSEKLTLKVKPCRHQFKVTHPRQRETMWN
jgi:hypothetical protein